MIATVIVSLSLVPAPHPSLQPAQIHATPSIAPTLLFYVFVATDAEYPANLNFFLAHAARADDGVDYVVVFQSDDAADLGVDLAALPPLPPNVHLVHHANRCFDVGTFGELLGGRVQRGGPQRRGAARRRPAQR